MSPSRFIPLIIAGVFALASLPALTSSASEHHSGHKRSGHHADMSRCKGEFRHGRMHGKHWRHSPERMAKKLTVLETEIGIRAEQLDAWRDFTDALLAMMKRPPRPAGSPAMERKPPEPFGRAQRYAEMAVQRGEAGENLLKAIEALRSTLTPEQLARVSEVESRMRPHHSRHSNPGPGPEQPEESDSAPAAQDDNPEDESESTEDAE